MSNKDNVQIAPAEGKLGILLVGQGAVTTTFIAGVEAVKQGLARPIGSLTQMATVRLGKRTEGRSPKIKDFVPLADLEDLVFGTWDIYEDNCYEAAAKAGEDCAAEPLHRYPAPVHQCGILAVDRQRRLVAEVDVVGLEARTRHRASFAVVQRPLRRACRRPMQPDKVPDATQPRR